MKKIMVLIAFAGMLSYGHCQDVKVNINNQEATTKEECPYRINGICITEDIGGVDVTIDKYINECPVATFTNYNSFHVTVAYELEYDRTTTSSYSSDSKKGTIVISAQGQKEILLDRRGVKESWSLKGIIVRKLAQ